VIAVYSQPKKNCSSQPLSIPDLYHVWKTYFLKSYFSFYWTLR
jgi:hypothetical protein